MKRLDRRQFLARSSSSTVLAGIAGTFGTFVPCFASEIEDSDPSHLQELTKKTGTFELNFSDDLTKRVDWAYSNSKGELISFPLIANGDSISHPRNPLLTWSFNENDPFFNADQTSQINEKFLVFTKRSDKNQFESMGVSKRNGNALELVGVITADHFLNDPNFPLPYVSSPDDTISFHSAIENFYAEDAFTCTFISNRLFVVVAFDNTGLPRILYYLDHKDDNQNIYDTNFPQYRFVEGTALSFPKHNLANDGKYTMIFQSFCSGAFLVNLEKDGLKIICVLDHGTENTEEDDDTPFLSFPLENYNWHYQTKPKNGKPQDSFLQALYNMGPHRETLLHWHLQDGHHVFVKVQKDDFGVYKMYPSAFLKAYESIETNSTWRLRPFDLVNTVVSSSHQEAPDHIVFSNRNQGCAFLALKPLENGNYKPQLLRHMSIDEKYNENMMLTLLGTDDFFYPNHAVTQNRRKVNVALFQASQANRIAENGLLKSGAPTSSAENEPVRYRVHVHARSREAAYSLDFVQEEPTSIPSHFLSLQSQNHTPSIRFTEISQPKKIVHPKILGGQDTTLDELPAAKDAAQSFWNAFCKKYDARNRTMPGEVNDRKQNDSSDGYDYSSYWENTYHNEICTAIGMYQDHYDASQTWVQDFQSDASDHRKREFSTGVKLGLSLTLGLFGLKVMDGVSSLIYYSYNDPKFRWHNKGLISEIHNIAFRKNFGEGSLESLLNQHKNSIMEEVRAMKIMAEKNLSNIAKMNSKIRNINAILSDIERTANRGPRMFDDTKKYFEIINIYEKCEQAGLKSEELGLGKTKLDELLRYRDNWPVEIPFKASCIAMAGGFALGVLFAFSGYLRPDTN